MSILQLFQRSPVLAIIFLLSVVAAITVHEFAHAWTADRLGDDTPSLQGRVTLDPRAHLDPMGSLAFLILGFGWGRPVEYNPMRLKHHIDELIIALAGPASNLVFALFLNVVVYALGSHNPALSQFLDLAAYVNVLLAAFNVIPIPPLDGSSVVAYFWPEYRSLVGGQIGTVLLLILVFIPFTGNGSLLTVVLAPIQAFFSSATHLFGLI